MFKGLKSKLEDQGKKLQASVAQYGEQLSEQIGNIRTVASDAGSDAGGSNITRRFLNAVGNSPQSHPSLEDSLNHSVGNALMEEVTEGDLLGLDLPRRERRLSEGSTHSNESNFSSFFQSVPGMAATALDDFESDRESTIDERGSAIVNSASKEQITSVLSKLQGRAANYKDKYRDLVKKYNEVVTENNKCRTVLEHNQDKAMERFQRLKREKQTLAEKVKELEAKEPESHEKLQKYTTMLQQCKARIADLKTENDKLRSGKENAEGESGMSDLAAERISSEWKQKIDKIEGDWTERMNSMESNYLDQVASAKKETYNVMESKDKEIELIRSRCHELEHQDGLANERWAKRVEELQGVVQALETEKTDMVEKLSAAKTQGVQAVRDEEAVKKEAMITEWREKEAKWAAEADERVEKAEKEHREAMNKLNSELESLRSLQEEGANATGILKATEEGLEVQISELKEKLSLAEAEVQKQKDEVNEAVERVTQKYKAEIADLIREHEELLSMSKMQSDVERVNLSDTVTVLQAEVEQLKTKLTVAQKDMEDQRRDLLDDIQQNQKQYNDEIVKYQTQVAELTEKNRKQLEELKTIHGKEMTSMQKELEQLRLELEDRNEEADTAAERADASKKASEEEVGEMRHVLEERNHTIHRLEEEKQELESELAQSRELSGIHEHLREELEEARKQQQETEVKLLVAEKTVEELREAGEKSSKSESDVLTNGDSHVTEDLIQLESAPSLESTKNDASSAVLEIKERLDEVAKRNEVLEEKLTALTTEKSDLEERLSTMSSREGDLASKHEEELSSMRETWLSLESEKSQLVTRLESLRAETTSVIDDLKKRADSTTAQLEEEKALRKEVEEQLAKLKEQLTNTESLLTENEDNKKVAEELKKLSDERESLEKELKEVEAKFLEISEESEAVKKEMDSQVEKIRELEANEEKLKSEASALQEQLEASKSDGNEAAKVAEQMEELRGERNALEKRLQEIEASLKEAVDQAATARQEKDSLAEKVTELEANQAKTATETSSWQDQVKQAEQKIQELEEDTEKLKSQLQAAEDKKTELAGALVGMQEQLDKLHVEKEQFVSRLVESQKLLNEIGADKREQIDEIEKDFAEKVAKYKQLYAEEEANSRRLAEELAALKTSLEGADVAKKTEESSKIRELEEINERMRVEFIAKEKIVSELREQLDKAREEGSVALRSSEEKLTTMEKKLKEAVVELEKSAETIGKLEEALDEARKTIDRGEREKKERAEKEAEEVKIREQYSLALENSKSELTAALDKIKALSPFEEEAARLTKQLEDATSTAEQRLAELKKEKDSEAEESLKKLQKAVQKQKKLSEDEASAAKAELLLQQEELRSSVAERERRLDDVVLEKAKLEQEVIALSSVRDDLEQRKEKEKMISAKLNECERRLMELEADNGVLTERKTELERIKEELATELEEKRKTLTEQEEQLRVLKENNDEAIRKAAVKQDTDSKKVIRELQREVKQLYVELNEKTEAADSLKNQLDQAKTTSSEAPAVSVKASPTEAAPQKDFMYEEELEAMRRKLKESHREVDELREVNSRLERNLEGAKKSQKSTAPKTNGSSSIPHDFPSYADPAEAEYLKNVLYRYMAERESLGKECVTLARVIGTVAKFNKYQLDAIIAKEESRLTGWVPGAASLSNVLGGRT